jgi:hypothetical protein
VIVKEPPRFVATLADVFGEDRGDPIPETLLGATVVNIGTLYGAGTEGGGLVIDYRKPKSDKVDRLIFGFTELGMWVESDSGAPITPSSD